MEVAYSAPKEVVYHLNLRLMDRLNPLHLWALGNGHRAVRVVYHLPGRG